MNAHRGRGGLPGPVVVAACAERGAFGRALAKQKRLKVRTGAVEAPLQAVVAGTGVLMVLEGAVVLGGAEALAETVANADAARGSQLQHALVLVERTVATLEPVRAAQVAAVADFPAVRVVPVTGIDQAAMLVSQMWYGAQAEARAAASASSTSSNAASGAAALVPIDDALRREALVAHLAASVSRLTPMVARELLTAFGSLDAVAAASPAEMTATVRSLGDAVAARIAALFDSPLTDSSWRATSCAATPTGKLARRKKIDNVLALSRPAALFNSVMLNSPLRTVRARRSSGSAPYGTSRASHMLPGVRHRGGNSGICWAGVYVSAAVTHLPRLPPQAAGQAGVTQRRPVT
ncbi:uncharacterized protein AMSG_09919 [Thecamonas trahens ATCC 50062]|uniref:Uncharacterized protein n=1 Tax=Thecamonas trahens ATCC 50062 TaxID=461836 RepID=A0A0L0DPF5_THETB|nr:hypothetical protein AMSG_09919 [Thecamonas trahens ATCC 50062]KNC54140.1 hypothetical protein AMSG_09919 [Thecamonas trahens ATCC 50062]|eukprot:XP_013753961.1 hypothetical protein AMSG_09919 [Thecamonas trahens ATCC 50062]